MSLFLSISDKKVLDAIEEKCFILTLWEINLCSFLGAGYIMIIFQDGVQNSSGNISQLLEADKGNVLTGVEAEWSVVNDSTLSSRTLTSMFCLCYRSLISIFGNKN